MTKINTFEIGKIYSFTNASGYTHYKKVTRVSDKSVFVVSVKENGEEITGHEGREALTTFSKYKLFN